MAGGSPPDCPALSGARTPLLLRVRRPHRESIATRMRRRSAPARTPGGQDHGKRRTVTAPDGPPFVPDDFINAYLAANGADPINLDKFRTVPGSKATGARQIGRLTNLMELTVDTSWWTRYRSDSKNPDLGDTLPQAVPDLAVGKHPAIPRSDDDLTPPEHLQAIANTAAFHFGTIEQGGTSLYASLCAASDEPGGAAHPAQHRPHGNDALPDLAGQGRERSAATDAAQLEVHTHLRSSMWLAERWHQPRRPR
jgi:hypothetical protein